MSLYQRLKEAYIGGKREAEFEELILPIISPLTESELFAFSETFERTKKASIVDNIPEEGSLERTVYDFRFAMGRLKYSLARL